MAGLVVLCRNKAALGHVDMNRKVHRILGLNNDEYEYVQLQL